MTTSTATDMSDGYLIPRWDFRDRLRKARQTTGLGQREFAERLGIKFATYGSYESGHARPRDLPEFARKVEAVTNIPAAWLLGLGSAQATGRSTSASLRLIKDGSDIGREKPRQLYAPLVAVPSK